jgi:hypothetical protein
VVSCCGMRLMIATGWRRRRPSGPRRGSGGRKSADKRPPTPIRTATATTKITARYTYHCAPMPHYTSCSLVACLASCCAGDADQRRLHSHRVQERAGGGVLQTPRLRNDPHRSRVRTTPRHATPHSFIPLFTTCAGPRNCYSPRPSHLCSYYRRVEPPDALVFSKNYAHVRRRCACRVPCVACRVACVVRLAHMGWPGSSTRWSSSC